MPKLSDPLRQEPTLRGLLKSLAGGFFNSIRQNKLASILAAVACVVVTFLAIDIQYDERPRYREIILPEIERAEADFFRALEAADRTHDELWRLQYFIIAHGRANEILRIAEQHTLKTPDGMRAHAELIRYYSLVSEEMAIIRTEMSLNQKLDYLAEWKRQQLLLRPIRQNWLSWVNGGPLNQIPN